MKKKMYFLYVLRFDIFFCMWKMFGKKENDCTTVKSFNVYIMT